MSNDLIQKNAELGKFLFCERYTLQPVKNALYIAEGQDLKRGAVVDVNGVLVGTNSLMPYAVLENDCDTRAKGAFASVFVKGEFNFDKMFFSEGLIKDDLDNIVYNGSVIGIVIKPYNYEKGFTPKQKKQQEQLEKQENINRVILANIYNPLNLPTNTIRCKFTSGYTPTIGNSQTLVDADENVWDIVKNSDYWDSLFSNNKKLLQVIGANTSSVKSMSQMFYRCTSLTSVPLFDTSSVTNMSSMFNNCTSLTSVPLFDTSSVTNMSIMFNNCTSLTSVPLFDTSSVTNMSQMFNDCTSLTSVPLFDTSSVTNMNSTFKNCTSLTSVPLFDTSSVTDMNGMFMWCEALTSVPLFDTSSVTNMNLTFNDCTSLTSVPLFDTSSVTNMNNMFMGCTAVTEGSLALYQQASTQSTPPSSHSNAFKNCGSGTTTGAAELAQIPISWGGTAA